MRKTALASLETSVATLTKKTKIAFSVRSDAESEETSPREEPDAEGTSCVAVPLGCHYSLIAVAAPVARPACTLADARSILKNKELEGQGATLLLKTKESPLGEPSAFSSIVIPSPRNMLTRLRGRTPGRCDGLMPARRKPHGI